MGEQTAGVLNAVILTTTSWTSELRVTLSLDSFIYLSDPNVLRLKVSVFSDFNFNFLFSSSEKHNL